MQLTINNFRQLFPDKIFSLTVPWLLVKSLTFPWQLSNSLTFPGFSDKWSPCLCHVHITAYLVTNFTRLELRRKKTLVNKRQRPMKETHQIHLVENAELVMVDWCIQQSELRHPTPPAESAFHLGHQHRGSLSVQQPWRPSLSKPGFDPSADTHMSHWANGIWTTACSQFNVLPPPKRY